MKDAKGHGSDGRGIDRVIDPKFLRTRGGPSNQAAIQGLFHALRPPAAHQDGVRAIPTPANADAFVNQVRHAVMPDLSRVARAPGWIERVGRAARSGHRPV